jgi:sodium/bile acid cotransporter 7
MVRRWVAPWLEKRKPIIGLVDRGSILFVVYGAFGQAVIDGIWSRVSALELLSVAAVCLVILVLVLFLTMRIGRLMGFSIEDRIVLVFCGSKKSLVTGAPMASILFTPAVAGVMIVPLMIFHQMQLIACATLARRYGARPDEDGDKAGIPGS